MSDAPVLAANFILDGDGKPLFSESGGHRHYAITLAVKNVPSSAYGATFELDPTYYDPIRSASPTGGVAEIETTSYGDYIVTARLNSKEKAPALRTSLSRALRETHADGGPAFEKALRDIMEN